MVIGSFFLRHRPRPQHRPGHVRDVLRGFAIREVGSRKKRSLQLRVLRLRFFQDGDVGVGVFPECEEILVGSAALGSIA